jgi:hypothetical protein
MPCELVKQKEKLTKYETFPTTETNRMQQQTAVLLVLPLLDIE